MPALDDVIASIIDETARGRTPEPIGSYIKENLVKSRSWFGRLLAGSQEHDHEVTKVAPFEDGRYFRHARLLEVFVRGNILEGHVLPSGGSFGLFAVKQAGIRYLNRRPSDVEAVLRAEERNLDEYPPLPLARLFAEALLRRGNESDDVLPSHDALTSYDGGLNGFGGRYEVDSAEWNRVKNEFVRPTVSAGRSGWEIEFCSLRGWMHDKQNLIHYRFHSDVDCRLKTDSRVLSRKVFKAVPMLRY
jgi:hypothetical protein